MVGTLLVSRLAAGGSNTASCFGGAPASLKLRSAISPVHPHETRWDGHRPPPGRAVGGWRLARQFPEQTAERSQALKPHCIADVRDRQRRRHEQLSSAFDPACAEVLVRRLAGVR